MGEGTEETRLEKHKIKLLHRQRKLSADIFCRFLTSAIFNPKVVDR